MEVILREDIEKLGTRGQVVKVAPGYARNFLLPKQHGGGGDGIQQEDRRAGAAGASAARSEGSSRDAADLAKLMAAVEVTIAQKAGENDQLFGSVTATDIAVALEKQGYTIDRRKVSAGRADQEARRFQSQP